MKIVELRVPLPVNIEDFYRCCIYLVVQGSYREVESGNAVEILKNEDYHKDGIVGRYTEKRIHLAKNVPQWLRHILTEKFTVLTEKSWNEYPLTTTKYFNDALTRWEFSVRSVHKPGYDMEENALNLTPEELKRRKIVVMELMDFKKYRSYDASIDVSIVTSQKCSLLPLCADWKSDPSINGIVCYKVIKLDIPHFGLLGSKVENFVIGYLQDKLIAYLSGAMCWIDQWYHLPMDKLRSMEDECYRLLNEKFRDGRGGSEAADTASVGGHHLQGVQDSLRVQDPVRVQGGALEENSTGSGGASERIGGASGKIGAAPLEDGALLEDSCALADNHAPDGTVAPEKDALADGYSSNGKQPSAADTHQGHHLYTSASIPVQCRASDSDEFEDALEEFVSSEDEADARDVNAEDEDEDADASKMPEAVAIVEESPSPCEAKSGSIVFTGYLFKLSSGFFSNQWNVRYIVVCGLNFYYFDSRTDLKPKAKLSLKDARIAWIGEYMNRPFVFTLTTSSRYIYYWSADTEASVKRWILLLQAHAGEHQNELVETMSADWYIHSGGGNVQANDANSPLNRNQGNDKVY